MSTGVVIIFESREQVAHFYGEKFKAYPMCLKKPEDRIYAFRHGLIDTLFIPVQMATGFSVRGSVHDQIIVEHWYNAGGYELEYPFAWAQARNRFACDTKLIERFLISHYADGKIDDVVCLSEREPVDNVRRCC